ncbi:MAG: glycerol dehydrogenase [Gammaproteobacteria bacterium]|nr:glycerol dehydrogenase [Gammaproteobacteria bacterium]
MSQALNQLRIAGFPGRYLQGSGALGAIGTVARELAGRRLLVVSDDIVDAAVGGRLHEQLRAESMPVERLRFGGECTPAAIASLAQQVSARDGDVVVGLGGGKTIDTAKGVSKAMGARLIVVPTIASNDSATSRLIVLYDDAHRVQGVDLLPRNPDAVVVDTREIARAPVRFFRAGIGDALSKTFEAAQCARAGGLNFHGGRPPRTAGALGDYCYSLLRDHGEAAVEAVTAGRCTDAVEDVTEATVLLSGLAFESGGLSIAHALLRGLTGVPALLHALHGEMVAFGTLVQLVLEDRPGSRVTDYLALLGRIGLPASLGALGKASLSDDELETVAALTLAAPYIRNFDRVLDGTALRRAIIEADRLGSSISPR